VLEHKILIKLFVFNTRVYLLCKVTPFERRWWCFVCWSHSTVESRSFYEYFIF